MVIRNVNAKVLISNLTKVYKELTNTASIAIIELYPLYSRERNPETRCLWVIIAMLDNAKQLLS